MGNSFEFLLPRFVRARHPWEWWGQVWMLPEPEPVWVWIELPPITLIFESKEAK